MSLIKDRIQQLVEGAIGEKVSIEYPASDAFGDYATPIALELAKARKMPPRKLAEEFVAKIQAPDWISKIEIAGAGFINFTLAPKFLAGFCGNVLENGERFGESDAEKGKTIVTDISHPNVAKPMGAHHLLSTIIGDSLNRIFAAVGYRVVRDNYLGDWGTQFGKLIYAYKTWGDKAAVQKNPIPELLKLYVKFHEEAEKNPELKNSGRAEFKKLEEDDAENKKLWKWAVDLSMQEFQKIWARLDVKFDVIHGESFYEDKMNDIIDFGIEKGIFVEGERGSLIAKLKNPDEPPCIIRKSDGATLYATRDLARIKFWENEWHPDLMINVVDSAQQLYFRQLFEVAQKLGITKAPNVHVWFGRMRFPEKKMSTRKGNIILMEEVLDEAEALAYKIVCEKNQDLIEEKKREVARQVGIGAVKYAVLSQNRTTDVVFTWDKILSLEGNSAPYLQYSFARARAILRKGGGERAEGGRGYLYKEQKELAVARWLPKFPEVIAQAAAEYKPNLIANYLYELASRFNAFYAEVPVLKAEAGAREARLLLTQTAAQTLKNGLYLLGIEAPEKM